MNKTKTKITIQNYGTSILLYINGDTEQDAYSKWMSLFNWNATSGEPNWVAPNTCSCWSTMAKYKRYLFNINENILWHNSSSYIGYMDLACKARELAAKAFEETTKESFRSINSNCEFYQMGVIEAESEDDNFPDACMKSACAHNRDSR